MINKSTVKQELPNIVRRTKK